MDSDRYQVGDVAEGAFVLQGDKNIVRIEAPKKPGSRRRSQRLVIEASLGDGRLRSRALLAGEVLCTREVPLLLGLDGAWEALDLPPAAADARLDQLGRELGAALLDDTAAARLGDLIDHAAVGTALEVVVEADGPALALPYELLRLPDGRLLSTSPGTRIRRRLRGLAHKAAPPAPGPLKILVAVGAPEETLTRSQPFDVEAAQQAILDAVSDVAQSGEAQVTILEVGHPLQIADALRRDRYHVLHLSAHGSADGLELEDEDSKPVAASAEDLSATLHSSPWPLPLVVLSSCSGAAEGTAGLAAKLVERGADRVMAMQASVTDRYATALARRFYEALAEDAGIPVAGALAVARARVEHDRQQVIQGGSEERPRPEYGLPALLCAGDDPPLRDPDAAADPVRKPMEPPVGRSVRELSVGQLIGRRRELRTVLAALRGDETAVERWGALNGVVLTGIGGIGKTAVAGRAMRRLRDEGWLVAVHDGSWSPPALFAAVESALDGQPDLERVREALADADVEDQRKLGLVGQLLARERLLLVLDDFERNLEVGGRAFLDSGFAELFAALCATASRGRLLVTCRHPVPGDAMSMLLDVPVPPLSRSELGRMFLRLPALRDLEAGDRRAVMRTIGGHPRLIEFVDAILRGGRANLVDVATRLRRLAREHGISLAPGLGVSDAIDEAVVLGRRDVLLEQLWATLDAEERELALQAAVSREPFTVEELAIARWFPDVTEQRAIGTARAAERLTSLTLLTPTGGDELVVHAWVAEALSRYQGEGLTARHDRAAEMRLARTRAGTWSFGDLVEIARHLAASGRFDELVGFALVACDALGGAVAVSAYLGEVMPTVPSETAGYLVLADRELQALLATGSTTAALERMQVMLTVSIQRAAADPGSAAVQHDLSVSYNRLGDLMVRVGNGAEAERLFRESLTIRERLAAAGPGSADAQRDLGASYNKLGNLMLRMGNGPEAERLLRQCVVITERLAAADAVSADAQHNLGASYDRLGDLMLQVGNGPEAERLFRLCLAIAERLATADPRSADAQHHLSVSYIKLGDVMGRVGNEREAERLFRQGLAIAARLATADTGNVDAQRHLSTSYDRLGDLMGRVGNEREAERLFRQSLVIAERLAAADPASADAQRDLSISYERLGDLMLQVGNAPEAERLFRQSLAIAERLATADPGSAAAQRDLSVSYNWLGDLMVRVGNRAEAERLFRLSLAIAERLAATVSGSADAHGLGYILTRLGDLARESARLDEAETFYQDALAIDRRLADMDGSNVTAQQDLHVSFQRLGDLLTSLDRMAEARQVHADYLAWLEGRLDPGDPILQSARAKLQGLDRADE